MLCGVLCATSLAAPAWPGETPAQQPAANSGEAAYRHNCLHCHADSQEAPGTLQLGRTRGKERALLVGRKDLPAEYIRFVVRNGLNSMPPFLPSQVSDAEIAAVAAYLSR